MQCALLCFFLSSRALNRPRAQIFLPPCFFKTDVNGPGRAALPASLPLMGIEDRFTTSAYPFKWKLSHRHADVVLLLWSFPSGWLWQFVCALTHHLHPLESQTQRHQQRWQRHRTEEVAHRDTPRSGGRRQLHTWRRKTRGRWSEGYRRVSHYSGGCTWQQVRIN